MALELRLVKAGYGSLETVRRMCARDFLQALAYEKFAGDFEAAYFYLNKKSGD